MRGRKSLVTCAAAIIDMLNQSDGLGICIGVKQILDENAGHAGLVATVPLYVGIEVSGTTYIF